MTNSWVVVPDTVLEAIKIPFIHILLLPRSEFALELHAVLYSFISV